MRVISIILTLLISTTAAAGSQSFYGSLRLKLNTSSNQPLKKVAVTIRLKSDTTFPHPLGASMQTDDSGFAVVQHLPRANYWIQLETAEFGDYSWDRVAVKSGEVTEVAARLDIVEELPFVRLESEETVKLKQACKQSELLQKFLGRLHVDDEQRWTELWAEYKLLAPSVDFKKWRAFVTILRTSSSYPIEKIIRVTYNPTQKLTRIRFESIYRPPHSLHTLDITCKVDVVLIPRRTGDFHFR